MDHRPREWLGERPKHSTSYASFRSAHPREYGEAICDSAFRTTSSLAAREKECNRAAPALSRVSNSAPESGTEKCTTRCGDLGDRLAAQAERRSVSGGRDADPALAQPVALALERDHRGGTSRSIRAAPRPSRRQGSRPTAQTSGSRCASAPVPRTISMLAPSPTRSRYPYRREAITPAFVRQTTAYLNRGLGQVRGQVVVERCGGGWSDRSAGALPYLGARPDGR